MKRNFEKWLEGFRTSIADYKYYVDFDKVHTNVNAIKIELNMLNSLVGVKDIETAFVALLEKYPEVLKCIPILLAKREKEIAVTEKRGRFDFRFDNMNYDTTEYVCFMRETGLFELLQKRIINNVVDYVTGVEVGLDSNGRKNRGGHLMEDLVEYYIQKAGFKKDETYFKEMYGHDIEKKWNVDLSSLSNDGKTAKRFDFVIKTKSMIYAIETNFYSGGGSKLNETARSYKTLALEAKEIDGFTFVWITDGGGWPSAKHNLEETFDILPTLYCINDLEDGVLEHLAQ